MNSIPSNKKVVLFDGVCNLCNSAVQRIIKFDKKNIFVFASLQSEIGKEILEKIDLDIHEIDSIVLYQPTMNYNVKSSAILKIINEFSGLWKLSKIFWLFPLPFRNLIYDFIAKNRYKWFGKKANCILPYKEINDKFLE